MGSVSLYRCGNVWVVILTCQFHTLLCPDLPLLCRRFDRRQCQWYRIQPNDWTREFQGLQEAMFLLVFIESVSLWRLG